MVSPGRAYVEHLSTTLVGRWLSAPGCQRQVSP